MNCHRLKIRREHDRNVASGYAPSKRRGEKFLLTDQQTACQPCGNGTKGQARSLSLAACGGASAIRKRAKKSSCGAGSIAILAPSSSRSNSISLIVLSNLESPAIPVKIVQARDRRHLTWGRTLTARDFRTDGNGSIRSAHVLWTGFPRLFPQGRRLCR